MKTLSQTKQFEKPCEHVGIVMGEKIQDGMEPPRLQGRCDSPVRPPNQTVAPEAYTR